MIADTHVSQLASELSIPESGIRATAALLDEGATVPFIARYRKEVTGSLDEVQIITLRDRLEALRELDRRRETILKSIEEQGKLSPELREQIVKADTMAVLEDLYLPYRPKRRTRGTIAKDKGLEPLAAKLYTQEDFPVQEEALFYVDADKGVHNAEEALAGARDIIAEWINEHVETRSRMREYFFENAVLTSKVVKGREEDGAKYRDYFDWSEPAKTAPSHRILAVRRGAEEGVLTFHMLPDEDEGITLLTNLCIKMRNRASEQVRLSAEDCYKRLLSPSLETEVRAQTKERADEEAIRVFAKNLKELLLSSPLGQKSVLALDPGLRTGCKLVCLNKQGVLMHTETIYPLAPHNKVEESAAVMKKLCKTYFIEAIAIGNGTGGREALAFCKGISFDREIPIIMVNESGASVYSASETARREFPDQDVTVRGSVSIGRRLMDPLAELVKIDPKSIGVGQYQHDVDQRALKKSLDDVVISCVNAVGVEVNTASRELLSYVSGLSDKLASTIVRTRTERGPFKRREELLSVPGMGPKTFEQSAGFLRIREGENPLDASAVHPESYPVVEAMARDLGCSVSDLLRDGSLRKKIELKNYVSETIGLPTLLDIMKELEKPGRDPRKEFEVFNFTDGVNSIEDVKAGMKLPGVVTNVTAFGAFVDIGVHQDGLVHVSQLSDSFVSNPSDVVKVHQKVTVTVLEVDVQRKRIALSMKSDPVASSLRSATVEKKTTHSGQKPPATGSTGPKREQGRQERDDGLTYNPFSALLKDKKKENK